MAEPFLSEIRMMSFNFPPKGWALCNGQLLPINQNQALFSLLGTTYGGDGRVNFGLPDLQGRVPIHIGQGHTRGERGGEQAHTLSISEIPTHAHIFQGSTANASTVAPANNVLARGTTAVGTNPINYYTNTISNLTALNPGDLGNIGGSQAHLNMQPFLTISFCIALQGIFPSQN
jgi:microcystin-dependent protein